GDDTLFVTIDSLQLDTNPLTVFSTSFARYYLRTQTRSSQFTAVLPVPSDFTSQERSAEISVPAVALSQSRAARFGGDSTFTIPSRVHVRTPGTWRIASWGRASANADPSLSDENGPRW